MIKIIRLGLILLIWNSLGNKLSAQLTLPPSGDNQKSVVTQYMGMVGITINYSSPDVHGLNGVGHGPAEEQFILAIRVDRQVGIQQVEVVEPVINPVPFPKFRLEAPIGLGHDRFDKSRGRHSQTDALVQHDFQQVAGREGAGEQRAQRFRPVNQGQNGRLALRRDDEATAQHCQWVVAIGLDQAQEGQHLRVADRGVEQHVAAPVLIDIAVAGVALRIELRR